MEGFPSLSTADKIVTFVLGLILAFGFWLLFLAVDFTSNQTTYRESFFLKLSRTICFGYAVLSEAALIALLFIVPHYDFTPLDIVRSCVLTYWVIVLVLIVVAWRLSRSANLSLITFLCLVMGGLLLLADVYSNTPAEDLDAIDVSRLVVHATQSLTLLVLGVLELTFQATPVPFGGGDQGASEPLLGGTNSKDEEEAVGPSRLQMALKAFRYLKPTDAGLRLRLVLCFTLVMLERGVNLAVPVLFKRLVDRLSEIGPLLLARLREDPALKPLAVALLQNFQTLSFWNVFYPWAFAYLCFYFLRGGSGSEGLLANIRDLLWIPITQSAFRRISLDVFQRLLDLDLQFHIQRKTGMVMRVLDRGTSSIQDTVSIILFNVVPQLVDITLAVAYLAMHMAPWISVIVLVTVASYVPLTICITERRGVIRKKMNLLDNEREARATDMLLNYETVKYFCNEKFELNNYDMATRQYQAAEYWQMAFLSLLSIVQGSVVWAGLASGMVVCVLGVARGQQTVGDLVLFVTMVNQLYVPLAFVGSYYRQVQKALIDMENMFELLETEPRVRDAPGAGSLTITNAQVDFCNVTFGYNPLHPVLHNVSFSLEGGRTMAVVGSTGSGKSTILRLLLRFYDPQSGAILVDGTNIAKVTQQSLRSALAVVPQDCVLFNDNILYNIQYGRPAARYQEVVDAAKVAHIHEAIQTRFPEGYSTKVGERGLRLSGGEKQRVAFARAVLKRPSILILDEATSALDSLTEAQIQDSLHRMRSARCTTLIVAHRLSTVMDADSILVLDRGCVAECGSHFELLDAGGLYAAMWARQQDNPDMLTALERTPSRSGPGRRPLGRSASWQHLTPRDSSPYEGGGLRGEASTPGDLTDGEEAHATCPSTPEHIPPGQATTSSIAAAAARLTPIALAPGRGPDGVWNPSGQGPDPSSEDSSLRLWMDRPPLPSSSPRNLPGIQPGPSNGAMVPAGAAVGGPPRQGANGTHTEPPGSPPPLGRPFKVSETGDGDDAEGEVGDESAELLRPGPHAGSASAVRKLHSGRMGHTAMPNLNGGSSHV